MVEDLGLNWYAYGARYYDPAIGRFTGVDPISDEFPHVSTYNYAENEPVRHIDLHGLQKYDPQSGTSGPYTNQHFENNSKILETQNHLNSIVYSEVETAPTVNKLENATGEAKQASEESESTIVHQVGITGAFSGPVGFMFSVGVAHDTKGNLGLYGTIGLVHGVELTIGGEYTQSRSKDGNTDFSINSLDGTSVMNNGGVKFLDFGYGSDTKGRGNYGDEKNSTYDSYAIGVSVGIPVGYSRSIEHTRTRSIIKKKQ